MDLISLEPVRTNRYGCKRKMYSLDSDVTEHILYIMTGRRLVPALRWLSLEDYQLAF